MLRCLDSPHNSYGDKTTANYPVTLQIFEGGAPESISSARSVRWTMEILEDSMLQDLHVAPCCGDPTERVLVRIHTSRSDRTILRSFGSRESRSGVGYYG